jgi:4-amino-4-deoxy-L-arabinose transferase-like glycosyltransferase
MKDKFVILILFFALFLSVWNIFSVDLISDDALYSFRALGWFDYLAADEQTGPVQWFGSIPAWANLSFHDAPPLVFAMQKLSFSLFGDNSVAARLPFVLSFIATVYVVFLIGREMYSKMAGYIGSGVMSIASISILAANGGYLEGIEILFISLSVFFWVRYLKSAESKYILLFGVVMGFAILCKYTAGFLIISFFLHLILFRRSEFKKKNVYLAMLLLLIVITPVIVYNISVFSSRGHFDAPLTSLFGQETDDFLSLRDRGAGSNYFSSIWSMAKNLYHSISLPLLFLFIASIIYQLYYFIKKKHGREMRFVLLGSFYLAFLILGLGGTEVRFLIILIPFIVISISFFLCSLYNRVNLNVKKILIVLIVLVFGFELFYSINSNFLVKPVSRNHIVYSNEGVGNKKLGFIRLEKYLKSEIFTGHLELERPKIIDDIDTRTIETIKKDGIVYFFDDSISWFAHNWYFRKYSNYYGVPLAPFFEQTKNFKTDNIIKFFVDIGINDFYYIAGIDESVLDPRKASGETRVSNIKFEKMLDESGYEFEEIKNYQGQVAFKVYKFSVE